MHHYTYKTVSPSGKYYVGRHSTENLDDGYLGSGKWIRSMKDTSQLTNIVLDKYDTFEELKVAEEILISENIDEPLNMNFNNNPVGFASGNLNPQNNLSPEQIAQKIERLKGEGNPMYGRTHTPEARAKISAASIHRNLTNPNEYTTEVRAKMSTSAKARAQTKEGRKQMSENGKKAKGKPTWNKGLKGAFTLSQEAKDKISASKANLPKIECVHCGMLCAPNTAKRWHGENCSNKRLEALDDDEYLKWITKAEYMQEKGLHSDKSVIQLAKLMYSRQTKEMMKING